MNTWKIHKYLKRKSNPTYEPFIETIRNLGLTQKSESIKLKIKDISFDNESSHLENESKPYYFDDEINNNFKEFDDDDFREKEIFDELRGMEKYLLDPYDDAEDEEGFYDIDKDE